jgi:hypothetical protein
MIPLLAGFALQSRWLQILLASVLLAFAGWGSYWWADRCGYQRARAEWDAAKAIQRGLDAAERARREHEFQEVSDAAKIQLARVRADAATADRAAARLRDVYAGAVARGCPAVAEGGAAAAGAPGVLADVLASLDTRVRALGRIADERGLAGAACEQAFEALR